MKLEGLHKAERTIYVATRERKEVGAVHRTARGRLRSIAATCAERDHFAQHAQAVAQKTNFAAFSVVPTHWNFANPQTGPIREIKQLHVEREAFDPRRFKNRSARLEAKRSKSALRVPKRQSGGEPHQQIKNAAGLLSPPRLTNSDQAAIQSARAKRDIQFTLCNGFDQLRRLLKWRRKVGVGKKPDCCSCSK